MAARLERLWSAVGTRSGTERGPAFRLLAPGAVIALLLPAGSPAQTVYEIGPPSSWVTPLALAVSAPPPSGGVAEGFEMLLVDRQEAIRDGAVQRFLHIAYRLLDEGAVKDHSQIEIVFDSSYQRLMLHAVTLVRDGRSIDQLKPDRIRVAQRESRLEYQIYDGSLSVVLLLEDVRRGDIVEYSYTRRGSNPVFAGHYMSVFSLQQSVPVHRLQFRLLWPQERSLFIHRRDTGLEPTIRSAERHREYMWSRADVPARVLDANLPAWYEPFPEIQLSDFASWSHVAAWGDSLFAAPASLPRALVAPVARIRSASQSPEHRVLAALRFVQDEVRYLGIEIGVNSHAPYPPATVIRRRYGDCKDKTLLLITMLRALGVAARPALVSTGYAGHVRDFHPTAAIFDHAIVRAEIGGRAYWLDPSSLYQRGDLAGVAPGFGAALVLGASGDSLTAMPESPAARPLTEISASFELRDVGSPADMRVVTRYSGRAADDARATMRGSSVEELQRLYQDFYAAVYPSLRSEAPPEVHDDETANVIRTTERYSIPDFWYASRDQTGQLGTFNPLELTRAIPSATVSNRAMPLAVTHPTHIRYTIEARMQQGWVIAPHDETIETPAVRFTYRASARGEVLTLTYDYETLADHVLPGAAADHLRKLSRVGDLLVFNVTPPGREATLADWTNPQEMNWPILLTTLFTAGIAVVLALRLPHMAPVAWPRGPGSSGEGPVGLGGWLILVGFGVSLTPLRMLFEFLQTAPTYTASTWARLTTPSSPSYHAFWAPLLLFELVSNVGMIVCACLLVWLFFRRKRWFPAVLVVFFTAKVLLGWLDALAASAIPAVAERAGAGWTTQVQSLLVAALWIGYLFRSRRVQNTFVN